MFSEKFNFSNPWTRVSENLNFPLSLFKQTGTGIGITIVVLCFFRLNLIKNESNRENINKIDWFLINGVICVIVTTKLFPWKQLESMLNIIQFPWRFLAIGSFF